MTWRLLRPTGSGIVRVTRNRLDEDDGVAQRCRARSLEGVRNMRKLTLVLLMSLGAVSLVANAAVSESDAEPQSACGREGGGAGTQSAASQGPALQEGVVTAQKRAENPQEGPIAITALSGGRLGPLGVVGPENFAAARPGGLINE